VTNIVLLPLPLRFRADKTLLLSLRFRTNKTKTLCCRYVSNTFSRKKHLLARDPSEKREPKRQAGTEINPRYADELF